MVLTLQHARERALMTQDGLSSAAQVSARTIRRIEIGAVTPSMATRRVLTTALRHELRRYGVLGADEHLVVSWPSPAVRQAA